MMIEWNSNNCNLCPRRCNADRTRGAGFCGAGVEPAAATIAIHRGEEPPIAGERGICNVFFTHCNLGCIYCQNWQISHKGSTLPARFTSLDSIVGEIAVQLRSCEQIVGLVSAAHYAYAVPEIVERLHSKGLQPTVVYNTSAYERVEVIRELEPYVDVWLPDLKYISPEAGRSLSLAADYGEVATAAILEMVRQKGSGLMTDDREMAFRGIVVRHLVIPGHIEESRRVLQWLADNIPNVHLSLMAQYFPPQGIADSLPSELKRTLAKEEYDDIVAYAEQLGLRRGWRQELDANETYRPHFEDKQAFKQ